MESVDLFPGDVGGGDDVMEDRWQLDVPFCSALVLGSDKPLQDWVVDPACLTADSESEEVLHGVDPNEVFPRAPPPDASSESDSGISEDPVAVVTETTPLQGAATVYQLVYDISGLGGVKAEPGHENVISIELDEWSPQVLFSDSCIVSDLPVIAASRVDTVVAPPTPDQGLSYVELQLTEEEQNLLNQEGVSLPGNLPLTKAEERILKKVRRKIRNKQSAQDSRRRRKEYIDGLESRAAACSAQNKELQRTVEQLEKRNMSLLAQLQQLQSLIKRTVSKGAQTSTCLLIILISLSLIILPSFSPFRRDVSMDDDYRPVGVISRNILTDPSPPGEAEAPPPLPDSSAQPSVLSQSEGPEAESPVAEKPIEILGDVMVERVESGNSSALVAVGVGPGTGSRDKPAHADEM